MRASGKSCAQSIWRSPHSWRLVSEFTRARRQVEPACRLAATCEWNTKGKLESGNELPRCYNLVRHYGDSASTTTCCSRDQLVSGGQCDKEEARKVSRTSCRPLSLDCVYEAPCGPIRTGRTGNKIAEHDHRQCSSDTKQIGKMETRGTITLRLTRSPFDRIELVHRSVFNNAKGAKGSRQRDQEW